MKKMNFSNMQDLGIVLTPEEMKAITINDIGSGSGSGSGSPCTCYLNLTSGQVLDTQPIPMAYGVRDCESACTSMCRSNDYCDSVFYYFNDGVNTGSGLIPGLGDDNSKDELNK